MNDPKPTPEDWSEVLSEANVDAREHTLAGEQAVARQRPKSQTPVRVAAVVILAGVIAWDVHVMTRPQEMPLPADEAVDLRWFVADAVELIEGFRAEEGRLPTRNDLGDLLAEPFSLEIRGQGYVIGLERAGARVEYDGSVPLDEWLSPGTVGQAEGGTP